MNCYVLIVGWLFLSLPFCCLRKMTPFILTLSPHLGTLTGGRVFSLSAPTLTAGNPSPRVFGGCRFGVYEAGGDFTLLTKPNSALHHNHTSSEAWLRPTLRGTSHPRTRFDFSTETQLRSRYCTSLDLRASMHLSAHFALARPRSSDFGHHISDCRRDFTPHLWTEPCVFSGHSKMQRRPKPSPVKHQ